MRISSARKARKMVSLVMSGAILLSNLFAPMVAYATEYDGQETELESEAVTESPEEETEIHTQLYTVTIPPNGDCTFKYDTSRKKKSGNENIVLKYTPEEMVEVSVIANDPSYSVSCSVKDESNANVDFYWKTDDTLYFQMPEKNVKLGVNIEKPEPVTEAVVYEEIQTENQGMEEPFEEAEATEQMHFLVLTPWNL